MSLSGAARDSCENSMFRHATGADAWAGPRRLSDEQPATVEPVVRRAAGRWSHITVRPIR